MKSFTKFYMLMLVMLMSLGMIAQNSAPSVFQEKQQAAQAELQAHGPTVVVPMSPDGGRAVGDDCSNPIIISAPGAMPYNDNNTTCGRGNTYQLPSTSCMYYYTSGEDIIYRIDVTANTLLTLTMNPGTTTYAGIGIFDGCPNTGNCLAAAYSSSATPKVISQVSVTAGNSYYVMIDTWASPTCISSLTLNIIAETPPPPPPAGSCDYRVDLFDSFGDGWNGCKIDVLVDGVVRLNDITLASGSGPASFYFPANTGAVITTTFTPGSWVCEPYYKVYDSEGTQVFSVPANCNPIITAGQLYGFCPLVGSIEGHVTYVGGLPSQNASVGIVDLIEQTVDASGYYRLNDLVVGNYDVFAFEAGINYIVHQVEVLPYVTVTNDYVMASPLMVISPVVLEETMNPNEWRSVPISIVNGGAGALHWTAEIVFGPPPAMGAAFKQTIPASPAPSQSVGDVKASALNDGSKPAPQNIAEGEMVCTAEEPVFSGAPQGSDNGQASVTGWLVVGQHFTATEGPIASMDFWGIFFSNPANQAPYQIIFYDNGASPASSNVVAQYDVLLDPIATGQVLYGNVIKYHVEFEEPADLDVGWVTVQAQFTSPTFYWMNTYAYSEPSWSSLGATYGPYAMCLGGASGGGWLDMSAFEGNVAPNGGSSFVNALFDASGTTAGQVWTATINFTAQPDLSSTPVAVSMIIAGEPLMPVTEFTAELVNMVTGQVQLAWTAPANAITFEYYLIRRNGQPIANTTNTSYVDILPTYGTYNYTLSAVYAEGESVPAGPEQVIWLIPVPCFTPDILSVPPTPVQADVWVGASEQVSMTIENCGEGMLAFDFTDFNDPTHSVGFVKAVQPFSGQIAEGESMEVTFTFSAVGYGAGTYNVNVPMTTNALAPLNEINVPCRMIAYVPATIYGTVVDCNSGLPIPNVTVTAYGVINGLTFTTETVANGTYSMYVDAGMYDVNFAKLSYVPYLQAGVSTTAGVMTQVNVELCETPYPVKWVLADPNEEDTQCMVTWSLPMGPYEIIYDDGQANNYFAWAQFGGAVSVKFTPAGYPATVLGGRLYVGDGSFPVGSNFIGQPMAVGLIAADGPSGFPGTVIDSVVVTVNNYGWVNFGGFNYTIESGNFYLAMWQLSTPPNSPPIGIDTDVPTMFRSYTKQAGQDWKVSTFQDFMLRATVSGPGQNVQAAAALEGAFVYPPKPVDAMFITQFPYNGRPGNEKMGEYRAIADMKAPLDRNLVNYSVAFVDGFDPNNGEAPEDGNLTVLNNAVTNNYYNYTGWGAKDPGFYAFAVKANYESGESIWAYSNIAAHLLDNVATFNVTLCDGMDPAGASLVLQGLDFPYQHLTATTDATGEVVFDSVIDGRYNLTVNKFGYQSFIFNEIFIMNDYQLDVVLQQVTFPPRNLYVDPLSSVATWDEPIYVQVPLQNFEDAVFPPAGWSRTSTGSPWFRTNNGSSSFWTIPAGDGYYACYNDDANSGNLGDAYLITPQCNLTATSTYKLYYYSFFNGLYGGSAYIEYTTDGGSTWTQLNELSAGASWTDLTVDLASISGQDGLSSVWFAFHYDDNGFWADGWAVDNVAISNGAVETVQGYYVFLDGGFVTSTPVDVRTYAFRDLQYGQTYTAAVAALYCSLSEKIYYTWSSTYLYPPRNLDDAYTYNTNEVPLMWNPPVTGSGVPMMNGPRAPKYGINDAIIQYGSVQNTDAINRTTAHDVVTNAGSRSVDAVGDVISQFTVSGLSLPWGVGFDMDNQLMYITDPLTSPSNIYEYNLDGTPTGNIITVNEGQSWVGDMTVSDGFLYGCLVGGSNGIVKIDLADGTTVDVITGSYSGISQRGLGYDAANDEFYIGGWNENIIYRTDGTGATIDQHNFGPISGLEWHPQGGPDGAGSLWIVTNADPSVVTEIDPNNGWATLQSFNIPGTTSYSGAGLALNSDGNIWICNQANATVYLVDTEEPLTIGGGGQVPPGLMSFNVYRDGSFIANVPYAGQKPDEFVNYINNPVNPGTYMYEVTAVYDLGAYGFPGQTGESMTEGPDTVTVVWGFALPFMEDWAQGTFGFNNWSPASNNWRINSQIGDPAPSAEFTWDPAPPAAYSLSLTSAPLNADKMTEGKIFFEYSVKLNDRNMTGEEKLVVEVFDGQDWNQVGSFANDGSFDWTFSKLDITQYAMGRVFQVRFNATGVNSFDIISWMVDNIALYRMCDTPTKLEAAEHDMANGANGAMVKWNSPEIPAPPHGWIKWDDGTNFNGIGVGDPVAWSAAARWAANYFPQYAGTSITKVSVFAQDEGFTDWVIKIWSGANAGTLIYSENVTAQINVGAWTTITLATPVPYDVTKELWVGYTVTQTQDMFPAGCDAGPAVVGFGDKVTLDGTVWENLSDYGLNYNWNIEAYVEVVDNASAAIMPLVDNTVYSEKALTLKQGTMKEEGVAIDHSDNSRSFTNFNVYRMGPGETDYTLLTEVPWVEGQVAYQYFDDVAATPNTYCYKVTAVWESATDYCESQPAPAKFSPMDDYVCVLVTDVSNPNAEGVFSLYPNPANDRVNISSSQAMTDITVYNYVGQVVFRSNLSSANSTALNTGNYDAGIYVVRINTESGVITRRVTITR